MESEGEGYTMVEVTLHIFAGRPDPKWPLSAEQVAGLKEKLPDQSPPAQPRTPPGLGYRGIRITNVDRVPDIPDRVIAYRGVLAVTTGKQTSYRGDVKRLEEWLLNQARELGYGRIVDEALQYGR